MKTLFSCLAICMLTTLLISSCSDSEMPEPEYYRVRIFDDTLADPRNHSVHIASGSGRLLMTWGHTFEQMLFINGSLTLPPPAQNIWMLTDNDGNIIKRDTFAAGLSIGDVISLPDNSFIMVMYTGVPNLFGGPEWGLHMIHLDANGVMGPVIKLNPPVIHGPFQQISDIHLVPAPNGNVLLHFYYSGNGYGSFVGEMDTQGNFPSWYKEINDPIISLTSCVPEPGGGYMAVGPYWDPMLVKSDIHVMKTNSSFDSLWSKKIVIEGWAMGISITAKSNGNYLVNYSESHDGIDYFHLLEINDAGEIMDSTSWPIPAEIRRYGFSSMVLRQGPGTFITHSVSIGNVFTSVSDQFNTNYITLDAELNITQTSTFQEQSSDIINSGCITSDGRIACFGITQTYDRRYYKPQLIIIK